MNAKTKSEKKHELTSLTDQMIAKRKSNLKKMLNVDHRLEVVCEKNGIEFVNDSKATDLESSIYAIQSIQKPIVWILEHSDFRRKFAMLENSCNNVSAAIVIGESTGDTVEELIERLDIVVESDMLIDAVFTAMELAPEDACIIYSPAAPTMHLYEDYRERGNAFKEIVSNIN